MEPSASPTSICMLLVLIAPADGNEVEQSDDGTATADEGSRDEEPAASIEACSPSNGDGENGEVPSASSPGCGRATCSCEGDGSSN